MDLITPRKNFHERIHIPHAVDVLRPQNVIDADDVLVAEAQQDLDFPQRALAVGLVLERADLLDGHALVRCVIQGRTGRRGSGRVGGTQSRSHITRRIIYNEDLKPLLDAKRQKMCCCLAIDMFCLFF